MLDERKEKIFGMSERQWRDFVDDQLRISEKRFTEFHDALAENTTLTKANVKSTADLVATFAAAKTGASFFKWCGQVARDFATFMYPFVLLAGAIAAIRAGKWPDWSELFK